MNALPIEYTAQKRAKLLPLSCLDCADMTHMQQQYHTSSRFDGFTKSVMRAVMSKTGLNLAGVYRTNCRPSVTARSELVSFSSLDEDSSKRDCSCCVRLHLVRIEEKQVAYCLNVLEVRWTCAVL